LVDLGGSFSTTEIDTNTLLAEVQTLPYRAPEVALGLPCGNAVDEWSIGVVLAEVALKRPLFPCTSPMDLVQAMASQLGPLPAEVVAASTLGQNYDLSSLVMPPPAGGISSSLNNSGSVGMLPHATLIEILGSDTPATTSSTISSSFNATLPHALRQLDPLFADVVMGLLHYNPKKRLTAKQALLHPFFSTLSSLPFIFPELTASGTPSEQPVFTKVAATTHPSATIAIVERKKRPLEKVAAVAVSKQRPVPLTAAAVHDSSELAASVVFGAAVESADQALQQQTATRLQEPQTESDLRNGAIGKKGSESAAKRARRERGRSGGSGGAAAAPAPEARSSKAKPWWVV
jgi:serine/threonine protein kinase